MISRRTLEIATAVMTGAFGTAIVVSSLHAGVAWTSRGVGSGTFPFIAGVLIMAGSLYNLARSFVYGGATLIEGPAILKILKIFIPAILFVAAIPLAGLHVAAAFYVFGVVAASREGSLRKALIYGVATPVLLYGIFDWGFSVTLPRGWLGAALGF